MKVQFSPPDITEEEISEVAEAMRSGWITTGPRTKEFEKRIAEYCHTEKAVCLNSATACLELTLRLLGVGKGDEVITSAYTYTASASVIEHVGAKIVLVDTAAGSYEMDYSKLEEAITEKTKVIIPVDIAGVMCNYDRLYEIVERKKSLFIPGADRHDCWLAMKKSEKSCNTDCGEINPIQSALGRVAIVADAAHAFGAKYKGKMCGEVADFTCFSFHAVKNLTTAEGGAVVWRNISEIDNDKIYHLYQLLSLHGQSKDALSKMQLGAWEYDIVGTWQKCNMTDIMAAIGLVQFERYPDILKRRKVLIEKYNKAIDKINSSIASGHCISEKLTRIEYMNHFTEEKESSGHLYLIRLVGEDREFRDKLIIKMAEKGIATNVHYKPLPMHTAYKNLGFDIENYPNAYRQFENEITLPLNTCITDEMQEYVIKTLKEILIDA